MSTLGKSIMPGNAEVYVLRLNAIVNGKPCYYVGKSECKARRIEQHKSGQGLCAAWVKHCRGVATVEPPLTEPEPMGSWEQRETIARILKHGFNNVRGWEWVSCEDFASHDYIVFKRLMFGTEDLCRKCGRKGHYASNCTFSKKVWWLEGCETNIPHQNQCIQPSAPSRHNGCTRCGRHNHTNQTCYASTHIDGSLLESESESEEVWLCSYCGKEFGTEKGALFHENVYCRSRKRKRASWRRLCAMCGIDISDRPPTHTVCYGCFSLS